ncbi:MAG: hypothetical protein OJJ54_13635 [Pseudonocardia sp.]|nr:hypothetical protein [Pseudonocardia sp.]
MFWLLTGLVLLIYLTNGLVLVWAWDLLVLAWLVDPWIVGLLYLSVLLGLGAIFVHPRDRRTM